MSTVAAAEPREGARLRRGDVVATFAATLLSIVAIASLGVSARGAVGAFAVSVLVALSRIDAERGILPNRIVLPAAAIVFGAHAALYPDRLLEWVVAPLAAAAFLLLPSLVSPGAVGMGDVKLGLLLGAALGAKVATAVVLGLLFLFPVAAWLVVRRGPAARKQAMPFGPFLAAGAILTLIVA